MDKLIINHLKNRKNKYIPLEELTKLLPGDTDYSAFATCIKKLEKDNILIPVKSHGINSKNISLYNTYKINKTYFKNFFHDKIQNLRFKIHPSIDLQSYYSLGEKYLIEDLSYIEIIDKYISHNGFPEYYAFSPQRSYEIIGDEKWIDEKGGKSLLTRLNLWGKFKIEYKRDPLMFSINPNSITGDNHKHMIVENKSSFYDFFDILKHTDYSSLIYGSGWKITSNISMVERQLGLEDKNNKIYYFGDLDYEGIAIWNHLIEKENVQLAIDFYKKLLNKPYTQGKENQNKNKGALNNFLKYFNDQETKLIEQLLEDGGYYPQELLTKEEIRSLWR